jgi:hypothetical protein
VFFYSLFLLLTRIDPSAIFLSWPLPLPLSWLAHRLRLWRDVHAKSESATAPAEE